MKLNTYLVNIIILKGSNYQYFFKTRTIEAKTKNVV